MNELIEWSRAQFALTACYHWLFVPLTLGLAVVSGVMETLYYRTKDEFWKTTAQFWQKLFGINFAIGVATGIILEFEFGTNWSNYSWFVGDIFGAPLAIEGILAFFMEATFIGLMFFGWNKVSPGVHLTATWMTALGASISAWWILVANSWMQHPVGMEFNPETVRNEMMDFFAVAFSGTAVVKFCHAVFSGWMTGGAFVVGVSCWYLMKNRNIELAKRSMPHVLSLLATHDWNGYVAGIEDIKAEGAEKIASGKMALAAFRMYRQALKEGGADSPQAKAALAQFDKYKENFGYGYLNSPDDLVPNVPLCFWSFRLMIGLGSLCVLIFLLSLWFDYKKQLEQFKWYHLAAIVSVPCVYVAGQCGWILAEVGRQPWAIQGLLPTSAAVSSLSVGNVIITTVIFAVLFTALLVAEIRIMCNAINNQK